jgi:hypothetical protein
MIFSRNLKVVSFHVARFISTESSKIWESCKSLLSKPPTELNRFALLSNIVKLSHNFSQISPFSKDLSDHFTKLVIQVTDNQLQFQKNYSPSPSYGVLFDFTQSLLEQSVIDVSRISVELMNAGCSNSDVWTSITPRLIDVYTDVPSKANAQLLVVICFGLRYSGLRSEKALQFLPKLREYLQTYFEEIDLQAVVQLISSLAAIQIPAQSIFSSLGDSIARKLLVFEQSDKPSLTHFSSLLTFSEKICESYVKVGVVNSQICINACKILASSLAFILKYFHHVQFDHLARRRAIALQSCKLLQWCIYGIVVHPNCISLPFLHHIFHSIFILSIPEWHLCKDQIVRKLQDTELFRLDLDSNFALLGIVDKHQLFHSFLGYLSLGLRSTILSEKCYSSCFSSIFEQNRTLHVSKVQQSLYRAIASARKRMKLPLPQLEYGTIFGFSIDIAVPDAEVSESTRTPSSSLSSIADALNYRYTKKRRGIAIEVDGPHHYVATDISTPDNVTWEDQVYMPSITSLYRNKILEANGWIVRCVPFNLHENFLVGRGDATKSSLVNALLKTF